jgi:hypothetical protein
VNYLPPPPGISLRCFQRVVLALAGAGLFALLVIAARLTPSPQGMGTHRQLGLPPCTMVKWFGIRCPSCGMTTSWSHLMHGHVRAAFRTNSGGALLAICSMLTAPWLMVSGIAGRWFVAPPHEGVTLAIGLTIVVVTVVDWTVRISLGW